MPAPKRVGAGIFIKDIVRLILFYQLNIGKKFNIFSD